jgi:hypothetical protein
MFCGNHSILFGIEEETVTPPQELESKPLEGAITVRYSNTFRDIMAFCFYHYPRSPVVLGFNGVSFALISVLIFSALPKEESFLTKLIAFGVMEVFVLLLLAAVAALSVVLSMVSRKNKTTLTEHTIALGEASVTEETVYNKTEQKWAIVQKLVRTRKYVFIYISQHASHVVPRRAFRNDEEWDAFYEFCRERTGKA